jgi:CheY-like chemotaxis protein
MDPTQVEQILVNLAVNARDAMPNGGKLTIETANQSLSEDDCRDHPEFIPGRYVQLVVSDSGWGMDAATKEHIFEPFFTTKEVGKGTGLGLATVYGIVRQNGGFITVYSEIDKGTTFRLFFAKLADDSSDALLPAAETVDEVPMGTGTILVVEDDRMVRDTVSRLLEALGYEVLKAELPSKAIELCKVAENRIDLLLTDVVMVEMSGPKLKEEIERIRPGMKVLFMSGYTNNVIVHHGVLEASVQLIQKPVTRKDLATKVAYLLGSSEPACATCLRVDAHEDP